MIGNLIEHDKKASKDNNQVVKDKNGNVKKRYTVKVLPSKNQQKG